jgi:hypothetical protein
MPSHPLAGPQHVLKYLARYTHRVAISNGRLLDLANGQVRFRWRDSKHNNRSKVMTLDAVEFIRRFLLHLLPSSFVKIRHFGLLASRNRRKALAECRNYLAARPAEKTAILTDLQQQAIRRCCPSCKRGTLRTIARLSTYALATYAILISAPQINSS